MLELTYHWEGDYLIPDLEPPEAPRIGKYGTMRHNYLRDYHTGVFDGMLLTDKLNAHLEEVDRQANEMMELLTTVVTHKAFGPGQVKGIDGGLIVVTFNGTDKKFQFPGAFEQGFLILDNTQQ